VRTKNDDKANTDTNHINIGLGRDAIVYVAYDPRAISIPNWLSSGQGWTDTGLSIGVTDRGASSLRIYSKPFSPGMVVLGGNQAAGYVGPPSGYSSNYIVLIRLFSDMPPSTPGNLQATAVSSSAIALSWTASTDDVGVVGYDVYREGIPIATTPTIGYTDTGLDASTMYTYRVRAFDTAGNVSPLSYPASAVTLPLDTTPPSIPSNVQAAVMSSSQIDLSWTASTDDVAVGGYKVYRDGILVAITATNSYPDSGLAPSTTYTYTISSYDTAGNVSPLSDPVSATTSSLPPFTTLHAVYSGSVTIPSGSQSATVTINPVDITKAFLVFGISLNDANPSFSQVTGQITNATTLTFRRSSGTSAPAITVKWYVAEFISGVSVQRGSTAMDATTKNIPLTAIDTTRSFPIITYRVSGSSYTNDDFVKAKITSSTNLELTINLPTATGIVEWQVIEFADSQVQSGSVSFAATDSIKTVTMNAVDTGKSWLIYTYKTDPGTTANIGQKLLQGLISNGTTLTFDRANIGQAMDLTWYLVEFTDGTTVQQGSQSFGTTETQKNVAISVVDPTRSLAAGGYFMRGGRSSYAGNDNPGVGWMTLDLTSSTNLQITRGVTGNSTANIGWFVISFPSDNIGPVAPTGLNASDVLGDNGGAISLTWTPSVSSDVIEQRVYRATVSGGPYSLITTITNNTTGSYIDTGLMNGTAYYFVVRAFDGTNESANSNEASAVPLDNNPPVISSVASGSITSTGAIITWTTDEASDSQVEYGTTAAYGSSSLLNPTLLNVHSINLSNLSPSTLYHYRVMSRDAAGNLSTSADFTFMTGTSQTLNSAQSGSVTIPSGSQSATVTINPVDITKAFLVFGISLNDANPSFSQVTGQITNATTLTFRRSSGTSAPAITVKWYVAEFISGVSVQRGSTAMDATTKNIPLTAIDTTRSFPIITYRVSGSSYTNDDFVKAKITSSTNLELTINLPTATGIVEWQVIEFADSQVQSGSVSFAATDSIKTVTMNAVDTGKSWLIYTYKTDPGTTANIGQKLLQGLISNGTTLTFDRANIGQAMDLTWYLVEFTDGTTVQQGSQSFGTTETQKNVAISVVDPTRSLAAGGYFMRGGRSSYAGNDNPGVGWMTLDLTSSTNLQITRGVTGNSTANIGWFVISFP
jgi:chitodextrinase